MGKVAQIRSVIIEKTLASSAKWFLRTRLMLGSERLAPLCNDNVLNLVLGEALALHARSPVRMHWDADKKKEEEAGHMEYHQTSYQRIHRYLEPFRNHNPQQQKTDRNLREHKRQECLHPIQPTVLHKVPPLRWGEVVFMSAEPVDDFHDYEARAHDSGDLLPQRMNEQIATTLSQAAARRRRRVVVPWQRSYYNHPTPSSSSTSPGQKPANTSI